MRSWTRYVVVVGAVAVLTALVGVVPVDAGIPTIVVSPSPVAPGEDFTVDGPADCDFSTTLTISVEALALSQTVPPGTVGWSLTFTVPTSASPGTYPVVVTGEECRFADGSLVVAIPETISLVKTVGTTADECATTSSISVVAGTTVYYCYTVTNNTEATLATHSLTDDKLGDVLTDVAQDLAPGLSANTVALGKTVSAAPTVTTTNTATWTAADQQGRPFSAEASATVTVTAAPAVAAGATPNFTG